MFVPKLDFRSIQSCNTKLPEVKDCPLLIHFSLTIVLVVGVDLQKLNMGE